MSRVFNFSAGPATLPTAVLERAQAELLDWGGTGTSIMEMSHRGTHFTEVARKAEQDLRQLLTIPSDYAVLFLQGGATQQFSAVPLNLARREQKAAYVLSGSWGQKAVAEGARFAAVTVVASSEHTGFDRLPDLDLSKLHDAAYVHITSNETIAGVEYAAPPLIDDVPVVSDMSSSILSREIDVTSYGLIYAGAQKNIGPSGLTLVIVREDLLGRAQPETPAMLNYAVHAKAGSMSNTPATFAWYMAGLVFEWLLAQGGLAAVEAANQRKSDLLYAAIDASEFYSNPVREGARSRMNVPFTLATPTLDRAFLVGAEEAGLIALKGHRSVGGMRASLYNAMPIEGVEALVDYMRMFEDRYA